jgi:diacylglycerol kinase (ATP)
LDKIVFILNPFSGNTLRNREISGMTRFIDRRLGNAEIIVSKAKGEVSEITKRKIREGIRKIVAVGGDGTVNEVARVLVNTETALGIIPTGSGNGLARHLNIPMRIKEAIDVINHCTVRKMDYGLINGIPFFCTAGLGFDAEVGYEFARKNRRGFFTYLQIILARFSRYKPDNYTLIIDNQKFERVAFLLTIANASQYGSNACISPKASIKDGYLDICILSPFPLWKTPYLGIRLLTKKIESSGYLEIIRAKKVLINSEGKRKIHYDGEPGEIIGNISVKVVPAALNIMIPQQTRSV